MQSLFSFWMNHHTNHHTASHSDTLFFVPTGKAAAFQLLHLPANTYYFLGVFLFCFLIVTMWAGISWWFWFALPWWLVILSVFSCASHRCIFSGEMCIQVLCPFPNRVFCSLPSLLHPSRTVHLVTTEGSFQKVMAGDHTLCWPHVCPAVATTTVTPVTRKPGSVWYAGLCGCLPDVQNYSGLWVSPFPVWDHTSSLI